MIVALALVVLLVTLVLGVPIPLAFIASAASIIATGGYDPGFLLPYGASKMNSIILLTIPLFVIAGQIMNRGGIGQQLIESVEKLVGHVKGGLGVVAVVTCGIFGAISGSSSATVSAIGGIMLPKMQKDGYSNGFSCSLLASAGVLGTLIPPSALMILYAWIGNQSVLASFLAGVIPGIILIILLSIINLVYAKKNPNIRAKTKEEIKLMKAARKKVDEKGRHIFGPLPAIIMPVIILGSIYGGILTPTESAAVSVIYAIPVGFWIYRELSWKSFRGALVSAGVSSGVIMSMLYSISVLSRMYTMENLPTKILAFLTAISDNKIIILLIINLFLVLLGMLMDDTSAILLSTPLLLPVIVKLGVSPIHFAAILGVNLGLGCVTPPTAPLLYLAGRIGKAELKDMLYPTLIIILFAWIPTLLLTTYIPQLSLFLPNLIIK